MASLAPPPKEPLVTDDKGRLLNELSRIFQEWLRSVSGRVENAARTVLNLPVTGQTTSIAATPFPEEFAAGMYEVKSFMRVTTAATTSSSVSVQVTFVDGAVTCTQTSAAMTGNTTATTQGNVFIIRSDDGSPISYATTYASNAANQMVYDITFVVSAL